MTFLSSLKTRYLRIREKLKGHSIDDLLWIVNIVPTLSGFSILQDNIRPFFWIVHVSLMIYIYVAGLTVFLLYHAQGAAEFIKSYVNIGLLILITSNGHWFLTKRPQLKSILSMVRRNDISVGKKFEKKHQQLLSAIIKILLTFYTCNYTTEFLVYLPNKLPDDFQSKYCMTPCPGLEPITETRNRVICMALIVATEILITFSVLNYQCLLCLLIAHTAAMYRMLSDEINQLNETDEEGNETEYTATAVSDREAFVKERLNFYINRHCMILATIKQLKDLYSMPIGVNFISHGVCIMLFFILDSKEYMAFMPILVYCILVFFLYCYLCQTLINASEVFERAVYNCGWENFEVAEKQKVYNMLVSAQRPVKLLAAYIIPVNIATFASSCQFMYKFVTVVKL